MEPLSFLTKLPPLLRLWRRRGLGRESADEVDHLDDGVTHEHGALRLPDERLRCHAQLVETLPVVTHHGKLHVDVGFNYLDSFETKTVCQGLNT